MYPNVRIFFILLQSSRKKKNVVIDLINSCNLFNELFEFIEFISHVTHSSVKFFSLELQKFSWTHGGLQLCPQEVICPGTPLLFFLRHWKTILPSAQVLTGSRKNHYLNIRLPLIKGMLYLHGNSELMCHKLLTIPLKIFWKFGLNFVPMIILSRNRISTLEIDPLHNHAKFHQVWFSTTVVISILRSRYS